MTNRLPPPIYADFTPAEVEKITGLTTDLQRVWRRRGQLPAVEGTRARFTLHEVAAILVRYWLSQRGVPQVESMQLAEECASTVIWYALNDCDGAYVVRGGDKARVEAFRREIDQEQITELAGIDVSEIGRFLVGFDRAAPVRTADLPGTITDAGSASGFYLDLEFLGHQLGQLADRPLVTIDLRETAGRQKSAGRTGPKNTTLAKPNRSGKPR